MSSRHRLCGRSAGVVLVVVAASALAAGERVTVGLEAQRVVRDADGAERLEPAERAQPGDVIEYRATYHVTPGETPVRDLKPVLPVPDGLTYLAGTATPNGAQASTDGATYGEMPLMRTVTRADGTTAQEQVPLQEYRFLRWNAGTVAGGTTIEVSARMQVQASGTDKEKGEETEADQR